ncbi:hypothetical protein [Roseomonas sp. USHLN139]|uniref:hypothetical protein n=1 Tax=Roseomonas sp. USHLN139 TaxID=3081298 RepID=UPI003B023737
MTAPQGRQHLVLAIWWSRWRPECFFGRLRLWTEQGNLAEEVKRLRAMVEAAEAELAEARLMLRRARDALKEKM